jgi:hypothetical protein
MTAGLVTADERAQVTSSGRTKTPCPVRGSLLAIALQVLASQGEDTP